MGLPIKVQARYAKFQSARQALESFIHENEDLIDQYNYLANQYNEAIQNLKSILREKHDQVGHRLGEFKVTVPTYVDTDKLVASLGEKKAEKLGVVERTYKIKRKKYDDAVVAGDINAALAQEAEFEGSPKISGPKEIIVYSR